jgi:hypothetical protein
MFCKRNCVLGTIILSGVLIALALPLAYHWLPSGGHPAADPPSAKTTSADDEAFFETTIRPVIDDTCFKCHGGEKVKGGLRLDGRAALLQGGKHGPAIVPGDAGKSLLIQAIRYEHEEIAMPPDQQLPAAVVDDFIVWVSAGAPWPDRLRLAAAGGAKKHWAFEPVRAVEPPADPTGWSANPIDRFVRAKWGEHHLEPARPADKRTLIRRVTFDLTGLPPAPAEVDAFLADGSPDAYERLVERLAGVEGTDDVVAVTPGVGIQEIMLVAGAVAVAHHVEPVAAPALAVVRRRQQPVHHFFEPLLGGIGQCCLEFCGSRRQADQVVGGAAD